jgi:hypothetical protein
MPRFRSFLLALLVLAAAVVPYARTLDYELVWDDTFVVGPHLDVKSPADVARLWNLPFDSFLKDEAITRTYFRPAVLYSLALDRAVARDSVRMHHLTNVLLYAAACLFLWLLVRAFTGRPVAATLGAIVYALHPTHPESVAFVSGRTDVLAALSLFAALWAAARFGPGETRPAWKLLPAALLLLPGLFSKEVALFGAPLLLLVLWLRDRKLAGRGLLTASLPVVGACAFYLLCRFSVLGLSPAPNIAPVEGTIPQILTSVAVVARYLPLLFFPVRLTARHEIVEVHAPDLVFLAGLLSLAALAFGLWRTWRARSAWSLPLALFAATLLPVCYVRLLAGAIVAERFLFVPSAALAIGIALLPGMAWASGRRIDGAKRTGVRPGGASVADAGGGLLVAATAMALWYAVLLWPRVSIWKDEGLLYGSMLRDSPESPHVHAIAAGHFYKTRDLERAAYHYRRAIALAPDRTHEFLLNLGAAEDEMGQLDSAFVHVQRLIALQPGYAFAWYALGNLYTRAEKADSAILAYDRALGLMPNLAQAHNNRGATYERKGEYEEALASYRRALIADPGNPDATNNLGRLSAELGRAPGSDSSSVNSAGATGSP